MGASPIVSGVLGGIQLVSGVAGASAQRKQVQRSNDAQLKSLLAQSEAINVQEQAALTNAQIAKQQAIQQQQLGTYQNNLEMLGRQSEYEQQSAMNNAARLMEQLQLQQAQTANNAGLMSHELAMVQQELGANAEYLNTLMSSQGALGQSEAERFNTLMQTGQATTTNQAGLISGMTDLVGAGMQNDQSTYNALMQGTDARGQAQGAMFNAGIEQANAEQQLANQAGDSWLELANATRTSRSRLREGDVRRAATMSALAASGALQGESGAAMLNAETADTINTYVDEKMQMAGLSERQAQKLIEQGNTSELVARLKMTEAQGLDRRALESMLMASLSGKFTEQNLKNKGGVLNAQTAAQQGAIDRQADVTNLTADQRAELLKLQNNTAGVQNKFTNEQLDLIRRGVMTEAQATSMNNTMTMQQNMAARDVAQKQLDAGLFGQTMSSNMNLAVNNFNAQQAGVLSSLNRDNQLAALQAQRDSLVYVPGQAPSVMGAALGGLANVGANVYSGMQQQSLQNRMYGTPQMTTPNASGGLLGSLRSYRDNYQTPTPNNFSGGMSSLQLPYTTYNSNANNANYDWSQGFLSGVKF